MPWIIFGGKSKFIDEFDSIEVNEDEFEFIGEDVLLKLKTVPAIFEDFDQLYALPFQTPALTVDIIISDNDRFLLLNRNYSPFKDYWALPGGFVELSETVEEAAIREAKEETGLDIQIGDQVGVFSDPDRDPRRHTVSIVFISDNFRGNTSASHEGRIKWFKSLPEKVAFDHDEILKEAGFS